MRGLAAVVQHLEAIVQHLEAIVHGPDADLQRRDGRGLEPTGAARRDAS